MPAPDRRVVVGLGNPGREYVGTRHNVGYDVLDLLARRWKAEFEPDRLVSGLVATASPPGLSVGRVRLVKPTTFMNLSGSAYAKALKVFSTEPAGALVVVDDFMMDLGRLRLRADGSSGGHNGLRSIEGTVGTVYPRLKIGIGTPPGGRDPADFVLSRFSAAERKELPFVLEAAADAVTTWLAEGIDRAMERFNRRSAD